MTDALKTKLNFLWEAINLLPDWNVVYAIAETPEWTIVFDVKDEENGRIPLTLLASELAYEENLNIEITPVDNGTRFKIRSPEDPAEVASYFARLRDYL